MNFSSFSILSSRVVASSYALFAAEPSEVKLTGICV
jgi:hypothetical protein